MSLVSTLNLIILLLLGTDIILCHGKTGKTLGHVDTNQLKNNMAAISPNGRFIAAAAFTADVKVFSSTFTSIFKIYIKVEMSNM